jgi:hypothetical protein
MALLVVGGCGSASPATRAGSSPSSGDLPPVWVRSEALWQSLAAGEPHPRACQWLETSAPRAARLAGSATSYLRMFRSMREVYVVVLQGHFTPQGGRSASARSLYLVLMADHSYLAHGLTTSSIDLSRLGRIHSYLPQLPVNSGLWGHTMMQGGPFPGGPRPITQAQVAIWRGDRVPASGQPLMQVRSDENGFFVADLAPGVYTLKLVTSNLPWPTPCTVRVVAGEPVAAGLYVDVP